MILKIKNLYHEYGNIEVLKDINCSFEEGRMYAIIGESGSGKTTLLSLMSGLDKIQKGELLFNGEPVKSLSQFRRQHSIIFQSYNLIDYLSPIENILIGLEIDAVKGDLKERAIKYLNQVGIKGALQTKKCAFLSGGQQQRVAIARTLANESKIIFADEPTGNLDKKTGQDIIKIFKKLARDFDKCVICVTHDQKLEKIADIVYTIDDGVLE